MAKKRQEENLGTVKYVRPEATRVQSLSAAAQCQPAGSGDAGDCLAGSSAGALCTATGQGASGNCVTPGNSAAVGCNPGNAFTV